MKYERQALRILFGASVCTLIVEYLPLAVYDYVVHPIECLAVLVPALLAPWVVPARTIRHSKVLIARRARQALLALRRAFFFVEENPNGY